MKNDLKQAKIQQFLNDEVMADAVFEIIQQSFLRPRPNKDVQYLAAKSLSIEFLDDARKDLARYKQDNSEETKELKQVGL